ncbi:hypothetical protein EVAR_8026_1 [Eumeta japonica]|uniref:DUF4817 domain-containing protein n=1 Tax=Eumeta variegata TaxID=151549 RepID=A0A4C1TKH6_EUMVA|nr:hypothetical protein EVAR_8026_1 [Eumeta japonica]
MAAFTSQEQADIVFMYGRANGNRALARRLLSESGIHHAEPGVNPERHNSDDEEEIIAAFEANSTISVRVIARNLNLSIRKVWSTMHRENKYSFHGKDVQGLVERSWEKDAVLPIYVQQ